mgnify:CR=1 FL=1
MFGRRIILPIILIESKKMKDDHKSPVSSVRFWEISVFPLNLLIMDNPF